MTRRCYKCGITQPLENFHRSKRERLGRDYECKACNKKRNSRYNKSTNCFMSWRRSLKRKYAMGIDEYQRILELQDNVCAICRKPSKKRLAVDHSHTTGQIRGLLCTNCNTGIGCFHEEPEQIRNAAIYIEKHNEHAKTNSISRCRKTKNTFCKSVKSMED